jgi:hypothetical protein
MSGFDVIPEQPSEKHFAIVKTAAFNLGVLAEGNGLSADQIRIAQDETIVHSLTGETIILIKPESTRSMVPGRETHGQVCGSEQEVRQRMTEDAHKMQESQGLRDNLVTALEKKPGRGFGLEPWNFILQQERKEYSVIEACRLCLGNRGVDCQRCLKSGLTPCPQCVGQGTMLRDDGSQGACTACRGQRQVRCTTCQGQGMLPCTECNQTGYTTHIYVASWNVETHFVLNKAGVPPEVLAIVEKIGIQKLATEGHAEIFRQIIAREGEKLKLPFVAFLPISKAEYSISGKPYPATIAGLNGRVMSIDPFLDTSLKPGINALFKLSKGTLAVEALLAQACKYRALRSVLSGLAHHGKRTVYQALIKEYPVALSDKYARGTVRYAGMALEALSKGPRLTGLGIGTALSALVFGGWFFALRQGIAAMMAEKDLAAHIVLADLAVLGIGYAAAIYTVKYFIGSGLKKILPADLQGQDRGLPPAGDALAYAMALAALIFVLLAALCPQKPEWILPLTQMIGL